VLLVNWNLTGLQLRDAAGVNIRAHYIVAGLGQTRPSHQPDVTAANHG
jgi:hypothetical protein